MTLLKIFFATGFLLLICATDAEGSYHAANQSCIVISNPSNPLYPSFLNCTGVSWTEAFDGMHAKISQEYAFTDWRGINWQNLSNTFRPLIVNAEVANDEAAYYQTLRQYFLSIHDGHVSISPPEGDAPSLNFIAAQISANVGGDYGLIITPTSDGNYVVSYLTPGGSASSAGIKLGDEVVSWNNIPITQAIANELTTWTNETITDQSSGKTYGTVFNPATQAGLRYEQTRLLTRDIIGNHTVITIFRPSTHVNITTTLDARDDQMQTLNLTNLYTKVDLNNIVTYKILPSGFGYLKIAEELNNTELADVQAAVTLFVNSQVPGIIIDVRGNIGGNDEISVFIAGFFYTGQKKLYESTTLYNIQTGKFEPMPSSPPIYVVPTTPSYSGQIIILTNLGTISSGEGIPMALKNQANVHILSFAPNTQGSFGIESTLVALPGNAPGNPERNYFLSYPFGRSLDKNNQIQVDANNLLQGGVETDIIIPMTAATAIDTYTNGIDTALTYAENCLQTSCWASHPSDGSSFRIWKAIVGAVVGVALTAEGIYLLKQHGAISASHKH